MMLNSINFFGGETVYPNSPIIIIFSTYLMPPIPGGGCACQRTLPASQALWSLFELSSFSLCAQRHALCVHLRLPTFLGMTASFPEVRFLK